LVQVMQGVSVVRRVLSRLVMAALGACALLATAVSPARAEQPPTSSTPAADPSKCARTAADTLGWGAPTRESDFGGSTVPADWHPYGPEPGHVRNGTRTPAAITVADGNVTITGTADGTTGAMSWHPGQRYGRWEACVRSTAGSGDLNALFLLWPVAEDWPVGGELDWMEISDPARQETSFFLHHGADNQQEAGSVSHDATQWSAYAVEWTPSRITAFVNGRPWYSTTETSHFPPRPMAMTMQLDYFGGGAEGSLAGPSTEGTAMHMDWARQWALPESEPAQRSLAPGDPATGQPGDFPGRVPRLPG
jgi:licheninase